MRVAVTGARGRLGSALVEALGAAPFTGPMGPIAWSRPELDLDTLTEASATALIDRDRPEVVIHAAAWTDVDGCARDPQLALRRNATATRALADACVGRGVDLILISTNEVFDGRRTDGEGYAPDDPPNPINAYGASKAEAERLAREAIGRPCRGRAPPRRGQDIVAPRTAGQRLPRQDRGSGDPGPRCRRAAARGRRRDRQPHLCPRRRRGAVRAARRRRLWTGRTGTDRGPPPGQRAVAPRAPTGRARFSAPPRSMSTCSTSRAPIGPGRRRPRAGLCSSPRRCRRGSRCAAGARHSRMPCPRCGGRFEATDRPPRSPGAAARDTPDTLPRSAPVCCAPNQHRVERATRAMTIPRLAPNPRATTLAGH